MRFAFITAFACPLLFSGAASAQECNLLPGSCGGFSYHQVVPDAGSKAGLEHSGCMWCRNKNNGEDINYSYCHPSCAEADGSDGEESGENFVMLIMDAAQQGDVGKLAELAVRTADRVYINYSRGAVQLLGCDRGTVIAMVPLTARQLIALETRIHTLRLAQRSPPPAKLWHSLTGDA